MSTTASNPPVISGSHVTYTNVTGGSVGPAEYVQAAGTNDPRDARVQNRSERNRGKQMTPTSSVDRHALAEHLAEAISHAQKLEAAVASDDPIEAGTSGMDLRKSLRELWSLRHVRSDDWQTILNKAQVVTSKVEFEKFNREMAMAVRMLVESHLRPDVDNDDVRATTLLLERAGFHPWKVLVNTNADAE
jgi:hypothetical protein